MQWIYTYVLLNVYYTSVIYHGGYSTEQRHAFIPGKLEPFAFFSVRGLFVVADETWLIQNQKMSYEAIMQHIAN